MSAVWCQESLRSLLSPQDLHYQWKQEQLDAFLSQGFPTRKNEGWKYTALSALEQKQYHIISAPGHIDISDAVLPASDALCRLVICNGYFVASLSDPLPNGVTLRQTLTPNTISSEAIVALNGALMTDVLNIDVAENIHIEQTLHIVHVVSHDHVMSYPRIEIHLANHSQLTIIESFASKQKHGLNNIVTQLQLGTAAQLQYHKLQQEADSNYHLAHTYCELDQSAQLDYQLYPLGAALSRDTVEVFLQGERAACQLSGLYLPQQKQHVDVHCVAHHLAKHTRSQQHFRGVLADRSTAVFDSKAIISDQGQGADARQHNKNILLSPQATVNTKPELQVNIDDVSCAHGATVGELDPAALFYLRSRGIDETNAKQLLLQGFVAAITDALPKVFWADSIREYVLSNLI